MRSLSVSFRPFSGESIPHRTTCRLPSRVLWNLGNTENRGGNLVRTQFLFKEPPDAVAIDETAVPRDESGNELFAQCRVLQRKADGLGDSGMRLDSAINLERIHGMAASFDQLLRAAEYEETTIFIDPADVSRSQPAVGEIIGA